MTLIGRSARDRNEHEAMLIVIDAVVVLGFLCACALVPLDD